MEERAEKNYYRNLLFQRVGIVPLELSESATIEELPSPVGGFRTLSQIRREATRINHEKFRVGVESKVAEGKELTEAEKLFQDSLSKAHEVQSKN